MAKSVKQETNLDRCIQFMKDNPGCTIVGFLGSKTRCFRLRDAAVNPIMNITEAEFRKCVENDTFIKDDDVWILNN